MANSAFVVRKEDQDVDVTSYIRTIQAWALSGYKPCNGPHNLLDKHDVTLFHIWCWYIAIITYQQTELFTNTRDMEFEIE